MTRIEREPVMAAESRPTEHVPKNGKKMGSIKGKISDIKNPQNKKQPGASFETVFGRCKVFIGFQSSGVTPSH